MPDSLSVFICFLVSDIHETLAEVLETVTGADFDLTHATLVVDNLLRDGRLPALL